jgi:transglutaminase-like putative cysteine protease
LQYVIRHLTRFTYTTPISESVMEVRMQPRTEASQRCLRFELSTIPRARVFAYQDPVGNIVHYFDIPARHVRLHITAEAVVEMLPPATVPDAIPVAAWSDLDAMAESGEQWENLAFSRYVCETPLLEYTVGALNINRKSDPLTTLRNLNAAIFKNFEYVPRSTSVDSDIDHALQKKAGVCQDFAHVMIGVARMIGIPCRYVSGYLSPKRDVDRSAEGATHAWVEAYLPEIGWVGFDPTNNVLAGDRHVRVAVGRDYGDVPPTRGVFKGETGSELAVSVAVAQAESPMVVEPSAAMMTWIAPEPEPQAALEQMQQQQ